MDTFAILVLFAGIVAMDTTSGPQLLISEPVVSCSLAGFIFGMPEAGLKMGILFQLFWLGYMPLGAARLTDGNMAAFISSASLLWASRISGPESRILESGIIPAVLFSILVGFIGLHMTQGVRKLNGIRNDATRQRLENGEPASITCTHFRGIGSSFIRGMFMGIVLIPSGAAVFGTIRFLPPKAVDALVRASFLIWGAVFASAIIFFWFKGIKRYFILGSVCGILWIMYLVLQKG
ncbi:PTS sugar transporter subunit IIC [bacterium]|nr:PTS sugar transporter subunit IIC [bacterium]